MKKFIKLVGTHGSGKSTLIKEISNVLTGLNCEKWESTLIPPIIAYNHCDCNKFAVIGFWKEGAIRNGMDPLHQNKKFQTLKHYKNGNEKLVFNFKDKIEKGQIDTNINADVIFEDGVVTYSPGIHNALNDKFELYMFHLDYPYEVCKERYIDRGSEFKPEITEESIKRKIKEAKDVFDKLTIKNKFKLSGTIEENVANVIEIAKLIPCRCMSHKIICNEIHKDMEEIKKEEPKKRTSLFE